MGERSGYPQGVPSWVDLTTSDVAGARDFYGGLFGWDWEVSADPLFGGYSQGRLDGRRVAGLGPRQGEADPVGWTTYLAVDDADKAAELIAGAGGTVVVPPMEIPGSGRMTVAVDPTGATFGLWQAGAHTGAQLVNVPGTVVWNELASPDLVAAEPFYARVLGVEWAQMDPTAPDEDYHLLAVAGRTVGGAVQASPPGWRVWFAVEDATAAADRARELGGQVPGGVFDTPQGPAAAVTDPQGGTFFVLAMTEPPLD